jgi:cellulose synthase/poly-beta-1,6-N-acetylglucosamine synthase-like glycosyltransferase
LIPLVSYVFYPIAVALAARLRVPAAPADDVGPWPSVTVAIAAHNEAATITRCVAAILAQVYPGPPVKILVGLDGCTDGTATALERITDARLHILDLPRRGKAATDNRLVEGADTDVIVTTAAGSEFAPGALRSLVAPLRDARVGCSTGVFRPRRDGSGASDGEGLYWRLEYLVMAAESRLGILAVASGTALAFRRALFRAIPTDSDADVTVAPTVLINGGRVVHVSDAIVLDDGPGSLRVVLRSRRRMALRALPATIAMVPRLVRAGHRLAALGLVVHKVFRWVTPLAVVLWAGCAVVLAFDGSRPYTLLTLALVALGGAVLLVMAGTSRAASRALLGLAVAQFAFTLAVLDVVRGRRAAMWNRDG